MGSIEELKKNYSKDTADLLISGELSYYIYNYLYDLVMMLIDEAYNLGKNQDKESMGN